jgi:nicotinamidase-related amidase
MKPSIQPLHAYFNAAASGRLPRRKDFALVILDVQREYCDPSGKRGTRHTDTIARDIARFLPRFRNAGIPVYIVYFDDKKEGYEKAGGGPYLIDAHRGDILVPKTEDSAVEGSDLIKHLEKKGIRNLFLAGFNSGSCITDTAIDILDDLEGYKIALLADGLGQDNNWDSRIPTHIRQMVHHGAHETTSQTALRYLDALPSY